MPNEKHRPPCKRACNTTSQGYQTRHSEEIPNKAQTDADKERRPSGDLRGRLNKKSLQDEQTSKGEDRGSSNEGWSSSPWKFRKNSSQDWEESKDDLRWSGQWNGGTHEWQGEAGNDGRPEQWKEWGVACSNWRKWPADPKWPEDCPRCTEDDPVRLPASKDHREQILSKLKFAEQRYREDNRRVCDEPLTSELRQEIDHGEYRNYAISEFGLTNKKGFASMVSRQGVCRGGKTRL